MNESYPDARVLYVYLTLNADEPSEDAWVPYSYEDIHRVLARVRDTYHNAIGDDVLAFLNHYLDLIGTRFMSNPKIDELCQRIYKNHRQAIDLIWDRAGSPASGVLANVATILKEDSRWSEVGSWRNCLAFVPKEWLDWLPPFGLRDEARGWIYAQFGVDGGILWYNVDATPVKDGDQAKRKEIITKLIEKSTEFGFKRPRSRNQEVRNIYCRVTASERVLEWPEDDQPDPDRLRLAMKKALDDLYPKLAKMASVLKPLCNVPAST
jgi:hypothetical protein